MAGDEQAPETDQKHGAARAESETRPPPGPQSSRRDGPSQQAVGHHGPQQRQPRPDGGTPGGNDGGFDTTVLRSVVVWTLFAFAVGGLVWGLIPTLFGVAGDFNDETESVDANATAAQEQSEREALANDIVSDELSEDNRSAIDAYDNMRQQNSVIFTVISSARILGVLFALVLAAFLGLASTGDAKSLAVGVALATIVGLLVFVLLATTLGVVQYNAMSAEDWTEQYGTDPADWSFNDYPDSDVAQDAEDRWQEAYESEFGDPPDQELESTATLSTIDTIEDQRINYGTLVVNTLLVGLVTGIGAAVTAVGSRRLSAPLR